MQSRLFRALVLAAAASPFLPPALAFADNNFLNIIQDGDTHNGVVTQTGVGNQAGTTDLPVHQEGVFDDLILTQSGDNNNIGTATPGRGLLQNGTASIDGSAANAATIVQNSNGNHIGELVQTTLGTHPITGNTLAVTQDFGANGGPSGNNTIGSIEQVQDNGQSANFAAIVQTGARNWLAGLSQRTTSGDGDNRVTATFTGNDNGSAPGNSRALNGVGPLAVLARSSGATASSILQGDDLSGGAGNAIDLAVTGDYNQFGLTQLGTDNSVGGAIITGSSNSLGTYQSGDHNQITSGGIAGDSNDLGIRQVGSANLISAILNWSSSDNSVGIGQFGQGNWANLALKGNGGIVGLSQNGANHLATIQTVGNGNLVLAIQDYAGLNRSSGDALHVSIIGDGNNGLAGNSAQSFTGPALQVALAAPDIPRSLLVAPDAGVLRPGSPRGLMPGVLLQWGEGNTITIEVGAARTSDNNLFAVLQKGNGGAVTAHVNGNSNQFVAVQQGNDDVAVINQDGNGNIAAIAQ